MSSVLQSLEVVSDDDDIVEDASDRNVGKSLGEDARDARGESTRRAVRGRGPVSDRGSGKSPGGDARDARDECTRRVHDRYPRRGASSNNGRIPKKPNNQMGRPVTKGIGIPGNLKECKSREESAREREERDTVRVQQRLLRIQHNVNIRSIERRGQIDTLILEEKFYDPHFMVGYGMTAVEKLLVVLGLDHIKKSAPQRAKHSKNICRDNRYADLFSRISDCSELSSKRDLYLKDPEVQQEIQSVTVGGEDEGGQLGSIEDLYSSIHPSTKTRGRKSKKGADQEIQIGESNRKKRAKNNRVGESREVKSDGSQILISCNPSME